MTVLPAEIQVGDLRCVKGGDRDASYYCIPGAPKPELAPNGQPTLGLWMIPPQPMLQLGARWTLDAADIAAVKAAITQHDHSLDPETVRVQSMPLTVQEAVVLLDNGSGELDVLAQSATSGYPPYNAIFSVRLDDAQAARVASALNGASGRLFLEYRGRLEQGPLSDHGTSAAALVRRVDVVMWYHGGSGAQSIHVLPTSQE